MKKLILLFFGIVFFLIPSLTLADYGDSSSYLGKIYKGDGQTAAKAYLDFAEDVAFRPNGELIIADTYNNVIRKITTSGTMQTVAGTGSYGDKTGDQTAAEFALPQAVATDSNGKIYVADTTNNKIKKISDGKVTTLVGSGLNKPQGLIVYGSTLYISDTNNNKIKKVSVNGGSVSTVASSVSKPLRLIPNNTGSHLYVVESGKYRVVKIKVSDGSKSAIAGSGSAGYKEGTGVNAQFRNIVGITYDPSRNALFVTDGNGYTDYVRKINLSNNTTSLVASDAGMTTINFPKGIDQKGNYLYAANSGIGTIHKFHKDTGSVTHFAGKNRFGHEFGSKSSSLLGRPTDMVMSPDGKYMYVAENNLIRKVRLSDGYTSHLIGNVVDNYREETGSNARFSSISGITINSAGTKLYVTDRWNNRIRGINISQKKSFLVSGGGKINCTGPCNGYKEGTKTTARFDGPTGIAISLDDQFLYVSDTANNRIRKVRISDGKTWLLSGSGSAGFNDGGSSTARYNRPFGLTIDNSGKFLYLADSKNHRIRKINTGDGSVETIAGSGQNGYRDAIGTTAVLSYPEYVKIGADNNLYFSETGSQIIKFEDLNNRSVRTVTGILTRGFKNGSKKVSRFNNPKGLMPDTKNNRLFVADNWNDIIRKIEIPGVPPYYTPAPQPTSVSPRDRFGPGSAGQTLWLDINGKNFQHGAKASFSNFAAIKTFVVSENKLTVEIPYGDMPPAYYDVKVSHSDGQVGICNNCFIILNPDGSLPSDQQAEASKLDFNAYDVNLRGGYHLYSGNVLGSISSPNEIITGTEEGFGPQVSVFDGNGNAQIRFFAYASHLRSGVRVASCDLNQDGVEEIITSPGKGGRPHIRIFDGYGNPVISPGFFALDGQFQGGTNIACGDVNKDGVPEILVAASTGGGPHVTVHTPRGKVLASFMAYGQNFRGGIRIATVDFGSDLQDKIITVPELGSPHVQLFGIKPGLVKRLTPGFFAFHPDFKGGLSVAGGDVDNDGQGDIIVSQRTEGQAWVKIYNAGNQTIKKTFLAYEPSHIGGAVVTAGDVDGDGKDEVMTMPGSLGAPQTRIFDIY